MHACCSNCVRKKGMTIEEARKLVTNPLYLGCLIIKNGDADGQLAGARNTTGDVLRPALQIIKTAWHYLCLWCDVAVDTCS